MLMIGVLQVPGLQPKNISKMPGTFLFYFPHCI